MNNALWIAAATGIAYKMTGVVGIAAGKVVELALSKGFSYIVSKETGDHSELDDVKSNDSLNLSKYERMSDPHFLKILKTITVQHILTEMDIEARIKSCRALIDTIQKTNDPIDEYLRTSLDNLESICTTLEKTLIHTVYAKIDEYNNSKLRAIFSLQISNEMLLLKSQSILLEKRKKALVESVMLDKALKSEKKTKLVDTL